MQRALLAAAGRALGRASQQQPGAAQPLVCLQAGPAARQQFNHARGYAEAAQDAAGEAEPVPEHVQRLATDILGLSVLECSQLSKLLRDKLGVPRGAGMAMMGMPMMAAPAAPAAGAAAAAPAAEDVKEKSEFDVKLESFSPEGKIKVIKEVRALTGLGLKEAKELVERAPVVVKTGVSKADAEAMQKQLEAVGGKIVME